jgi:hypothetical protein
MIPGRGGGHERLLGAGALERGRPALVAEAVEALLDIGGVADLARLAVVDHVERLTIRSLRRCL